MADVLRIVSEGSETRVPFERVGQMVGLAADVSGPNQDVTLELALNREIPALLLASFEITSEAVLHEHRQDKACAAGRSVAG